MTRSRRQPSSTSPDAASPHPDAASPRSGDPAAAGPSPGLCARCLHSHVVVSDRGSTFYRCTLADVDERFVRYPRLPVRSCPGWLPDVRGSGGSGRSEESAGSGRTTG